MIKEENKERIHLNWVFLISKTGIVKTVELIFITMVVEINVYFQQYLNNLTSGTCRTKCKRIVNAPRL